MRSRQARGYTAAPVHSLPNPLGDAVTAAGERGNRSATSPEVAEGANRVGPRGIGR